MFQQGDFILGPQQVDQRRAQILRMMPQFGSANYTGEGLAHLLAGLVGSNRLRDLQDYEAEQRERVSGLFGDMQAFDPWMTAEQRKAMKK